MRWIMVCCLIGLVALPGLAGADFHPDCRGAVTAYANTFLEASDDGETLTYSGTVNCPNTTVTIGHLQINPVGSDALDVTKGDTCIATLVEPCSLSGTVDAPEPGVYRVNMTFSTPGFYDVERAQHFQWLGAGQPVPVCVHAGALPYQNGLC